MNFLKKNSARQELCKKRQEKKLPDMKRRLAWLGALALAFIVLGALAWHFLPMHYARFYLTRSALQTRGCLMDLWGKELKEEGTDETVLKLVADEVEWNGHSVLVLPGGFGISWEEQRNEENTFAQGSLDVYFLGAIRDGIHYWADQENAVISVPGITGAAIRTSQEALKKNIGFSIAPEDRIKLKDRMKTLKNDTVHMMNQSRMEFAGRNENNVTIQALVPSALFDAYLDQIADLLEDGPGKDTKEWAEMLRERKTQGDTQEILFTIDKQLHITEIRIEGLADMSLLLEPHDGLSMKSRVSLDGRELDVNARIYSGNGQAGKRTFQIPELAITYHNERFRLRLKLSGGYEGGKRSSEVLDYGKLSENGENSDGEVLQQQKDEFLKRAGQLGLDFYK
ncbi:hypothetical protein Closa_4028 [[Clostridium] saccharolyticum WM1]|uniref:Uncharacterized protein n=1 Tax=Lacrimispora saccharolytica (strain ATCC 35040 / DSM 2544 / NRCC 2533 / WM1) TaxID=610130 RepID=D9R1L6_LACSW|nr:hypothetical protein [Lacrimispora saccharolytica]ADL06539.1 hypothetical protein Closa_4028 [[Clostridium] saccharolyticum WM1]